MVVFDACGDGGAGVSRRDGQVAQSAQRAERLAAKAERVETLEVVVLVYLGRVVLERNGLKVGLGDAGTVVDDLDELAAVLLEADLDRLGVGVQTVLHQLLDRIRQVDDHLARAYAMHRVRIERLDT